MAAYPFEQWRADIAAFLATHGLKVRYAPGLDFWRAQSLAEQPDNKALNPLFYADNDPADPADALSIWFERDGRTIAWIASRLDICDDYIPFTFDLIAVTDAPRHKMQVDPDSAARLPRISGRVVHSGGAYVLPALRGGDYAGHSLAYYLTRLLRIWALADKQANWIVGYIIAQALREKKVAQKIYGYPHVDIVMRAFPYPFGMPAAPLQINYMTRAEALSDLQRDMSALAGARDAG